MRQTDSTILYILQALPLNTGVGIKMFYISST